MENLKTDETNRSFKREVFIAGVLTTITGIAGIFVGQYMTQSSDEKSHNAFKEKEAKIFNNAVTKMKSEDGLETAYSLQKENEMRVEFYVDPKDGMIISDDKQNELRKMPADKAYAAAKEWGQAHGVKVNYRVVVPLQGK